MPNLRSLDLFSGIGGITLGFERAGIKTVAFCEIDEGCIRVLNKHWPSVPIFGDIRSLHASDVPEDIDIITGGFPCQDLSSAGRGRGLNAARSGLWWEMLRIVGEVRPRYVVVENVRNLLSSGKSWFGAFLRSLAEVGYDAEWSCIPAAYAGACHIRDRVFVVAYPSENGSKSYPLLQSEYRFSNSLERPTNYDRVIATARRPFAPRSLEIYDRNDGLSAALDGIGQLGNAVVPQIAQAIGEAIVRDAARKVAEV